MAKRNFSTETQSTRRGITLDIFVLNLRELCASVVKTGSSTLFLRFLRSPLFVADHDATKVRPELLLFFDGKDSTHSLKCTFVLSARPIMSRPGGQKERRVRGGWIVFGRTSIS
jgi:hypothetical protein